MKYRILPELCYLKRPWKWVRYLFRNLKDIWHRGRYGWAPSDTWDFCTWYPRVGAAAMEYFSSHNECCPIDWTFNTWNEYISYLGKRLERCAVSQDIGFGEERNEYGEMLNEIMRHRRQEVRHPDGSITIKHELTPEEEDIRKRYFAREKEIHDADQAYIKDTYRFLGEDLTKIWW
jgi:hypothetical protein